MHVPDNGKHTVEDGKDKNKEEKKYGVIPYQ
jgi:hypothetical protein